MENIESDIRKKMLMNIFNTLVKKLNRDNKIIYCNNHAMEKAKLIEYKLYNNCQIYANNWIELYNGVDADVLVGKIESKTPKCLY